MDIVDDQTKFYEQHLRRVEKFHMFVMSTGMLAFAMKPFVLSDMGSMFGCYVPPEVPYPLYYIFELYVLSFLSAGFVSFNVLICSLIILVVNQFRLLNYKIKAIDFSGIENGQGLDARVEELKHKIKYHQFLIRC
uniref:Odorant receptor 27 n=1 Tax=Apriona germarii TaxID=157307 RepID=A0A7G7WNC5_APRGE|nr:odorant receptor 27 [Apriona germarii]